MNHQELIDLFLEGKLSDEQSAELEAALLIDPELMSSYVQQRWLHSELLTNKTLLSNLDEQILTRPQRFIYPWVALAAAAVLTIFSILTLTEREKFEPVATLIEAENCRWDGSDLPTSEGSLLGAGTLALAEGMATLQFESGATVTLEAPTVLEVESAMRCRLIEGSVVADVPESAHGFTIDTEKMEVIDLGTRFGVTSTPVGGAHVFVFDGEVKVKEENREEPTHILSGKSLHRGAPPESPDQEITQRPQIDSSLSHWVPVSTAFGRGKDAYIRRTDSSRKTGSAPLLMVKHTDLAEGNERRAILTFDLSRIKKSEMSEAILTLMMESSGLGFSSLVPDSTFAIYGAASPSLHTWPEHGVTWNDSPRLTTEKPEHPDFTHLADFTIPKGTANTLIEVNSDELSRFLLSSHETLVTLLIVRETGEFDKQGLVHAFASKEHPAGPAPTLWFQPVSTP